MDAIKRPLKIPPEFGRYAEEKGVFQLYERLLSALLMHRPEEPLQFLAEYLSRGREDAPAVIIYGPPASGQHTISRLAARKLRAVHVRPARVLQDDCTPSGEEARKMVQQGQEVGAGLWATLLQSRLKQQDCIDKGWVLEGFPRTREQALALQAAGVIAKHFVHLNTADAVLEERYAGKRIDPLTGDVYHTVFDPPKSSEVAARLVTEPGGPEENLTSTLLQYHRHAPSLLSCYQRTTKSINADQPIGDVFAEVFSFLGSRERSTAPYTPRVLLLGATGAGKSLQAAQLANKYRLVPLDCAQLLRQELISGSRLADQMKPFRDRNMMIPDDMVMSVLGGWLSQEDCVSRGWVLHGFPLNRDQAELLASAGHTPNRVFVLNIAEDAVIERLTLRRTDPATGDSYHLLYKPPPPSLPLDTLTQHPRDSEQRVRGRLAAHQAAVEELLEHYPHVQQLNADQDPLAVFETLENVLLHPLPSNT